MWECNYFVYLHPKLLLQTVTMKYLASVLLMIMVGLGRVNGQTGHFFPSDNFSSGLISSLYQDKYGSIWIATDYGLNRFDGYHFTSFLHDDKDSWSLCNNAAVCMLTDRAGRFWIGTNRGLDRYDGASNGFVHYQFPDDILPRVSDMAELPDGRLLVVTAGYGAFLLGEDGVLQPTDDYADKDNNRYYSKVFVDSRGRFWKSGYDNTVLMKQNGKFQSFQSKGEPVRFIERENEVLIVGNRGFMSYRNAQITEADIDLSIMAGKDVMFSSACKDAMGNLYIGTRGNGLYRVARGSRRLERVEATVLGVDLNTAKVSSILADRQGNLWLGLQQKGMVIIPQHPMQFRNWSFQSQNINLGSSITSVCEGDGGITWCTVQGVGVYGFDARGRVVAHPAAPDAVEFIFRDRQNHYWIGTDDGLYAYNPLSGSYSQKVSFECDKFNDMTSDSLGNIYISTFSRGFCVYNPQSGSLRNYRNSEDDTIKGGHLCNDWIMCMMPDRNGMIWMGTASGVSCFDPKTNSFNALGWNQLLDNVMCFAVCELRNGNVAIGTAHGLYLYNRKTKKTERFPESEELDDKAVSYIIQSNNGDVWCSTSVGIWQYDLSAKRFVGHVNGNGLNKKEYLYGVGMHTNNDMVYFGHNDGLVVFNPHDIESYRPSADVVYLTDLLVGRTYVNSRMELNGVQVTDKPVIESDRFTLSYLDHTVTLYFSQLNFENPSNVSFEYSVNGSEWVRRPEGENEFTLNHLQPGTYHLQVRALAGNVYSPVKEITIEVRAPWYRTRLAYTLYLLTFLALVGFIFITYRRRANEQMNEEKMKFLINATHDIRSPLTLIMSPLANLKRRLTSEQADAIRDVDTIEHNATRILNLVNQILDVRKIDKQQMKLHCEQVDLVAFIAGVCKMFEYNAQERQIQFDFHHEGIDELKVWVDRGQFDKVVTNLLSNAFKYSFDKGAIEVRLSSDGANAQIEVADNGIGLDGDNMKHLFERFYQGGNSRRFHIDGTGIGLNLCKMIVDMHHGTIIARNRTDMRGSVFTVSLPLGRDHLTDEEIDMSTENTDELIAASNAQTPNSSVQSSKYHILIVDDDAEIRQYISTELGRYYKFGTCSNGKEGLKELLTNEYDLVISDVMMPEMDGFTMLRMIKTNANISHLPVVMLTSKADVGNRLEGLERGADAFLAKPFDMQELHSVIDNLIHNRQRLKGKYSGAQQQANRIEQPEVKGNDELLMERIMKVVNKNLSNSDFNVDMLTQEVGISRAQLHRKMKEMTGISTSEFIRNIRLEQAARLLREQKINVTQVAYTVGFSNLAHFSTIFRKHFGISPSEYAEREN